MIYKISAPQFIWVDLEKGSPDEITQVIQEFGMHPLVQLELERPARFPRIEQYGEHILVIIQIPFLDEKIHDIKAGELDIVIGKNIILTWSTTPIAAIQRVKEMMAREEDREKIFKSEVGFLLYTILFRIFEDVMPLLDQVESTIEQIEEGLFEGKEQELVPLVSLAHRNVIDLRRALYPAKPVIESLVSEEKGFFDKHSLVYLRTILTLEKRIAHVLDMHRETLMALEQTTQAIFSTKRNEIIRILTVVTAIPLPFIIVASVYGMNVKFPLVGAHGDFFLLLGIMFALSGLMAVVFRMRQWI